MRVGEIIDQLSLHLLSTSFYPSGVGSGEIRWVIFKDSVLIKVIIIVGLKYRNSMMEVQYEHYFFNGSGIENCQNNS